MYELHSPSLNWENQRHVLIGKAEHGPISIFTPGYLVLFLAYTATAKPFVSLPTSWDRPTRARFLYEAGEALEQGVMSNTKRFLASRTIGYLLRQNQLPPLQLPPLMVHPVFRRRIGVIRKAVYRSLQQVRNAYSRSWIVARLRVCFVKARTWHSTLRVKADIESFDLAQLRHQTKEELGHLATMPSLRAIIAPWRLGRWPTTAHIRRQTILQSRCWTRQCQLPSRARGALTTFWLEFLGAWHLPRPPEEWREYELVMRGAAKQGRTLVPDDRDPAKAWSVRTEELVCHLLVSTLEDKMWSQRPGIQPAGVLQWLHGRAFLGIPGFLRKHVRPTGDRQCSAPLLFGFVKSKCFTDEGTRVCDKAGHSCVRRVLDMSCIPNARGWKTQFGVQWRKPGWARKCLHCETLFPGYVRKWRHYGMNSRLELGQGNGHVHVAAGRRRQA